MRGRVHVIGLVLGIKLALLAVGVLAAEVRLGRPVRTRAELYSVIYRWDALRYVAVARNGYAAPPGSASLTVPPLFPASIAACRWLGASYEAAAFGAATLASLLAALAFHGLCRLDHDEAHATRALALLLLFPAGFFLHLPYSEALFLALACGGFLAARTGRYWLAALLAALAGLTRINGFLLAPALAVEAFTGKAQGPLAGRLAAVLGAPLGLCGYLLLNFVVAGDALAFLRIHSSISARSFAWPWVGAADAWRAAATGGGQATMVGTVELAFALLAALATLRAVWTLRPAYSVWMAGNLLLFCAQGFWLSIPRLSLALFPMFLLFSGRGAIGYTLLLGGFALLQGFFVSQYVQGWWVS